MAETLTPAPSVATGGDMKSNSYQLPSVEYLLESVASDILSLSLHVATIAMLLTASLRPDAKHSLRACRHLLHDDHKALELALRYAVEIGLPREAAQKLVGLCGDLADAQKRLAPLAQASAMGRHQREQALAQATAWRRLAGEMTSVLAMVAGSVTGRLNPVYAEDVASLRDFLKRASDGDASAVDAAGAIHLPALKQQRRKPRIVVNLPCTVTTAAGSTPAKLEDVSRHGFGLFCTAPLTLRQSVTITLTDGRRIAAVVARGKAPRYGLAISKPLAERDPLLLGAVRSVAAASRG
jgi:hypothetical protein